MSNRFDALVSWFAAPLGRHTGYEIVVTVVRDLGFSPTALEEDDVTKVLEVLEKRDGVVALVARGALRRMGKRPPTQTSLAAVTPRREGELRPRSGTFAAVEETVRREELEALLAAALPEGAAREALAAYTPWLDGGQCTPARALALLDRMAQDGGAIGVAATFAKANWHLRRARSTA
jgi:hypothetical protein